MERKQEKECTFSWRKKGAPPSMTSKWGLQGGDRSQIIYGEAKWNEITNQLKKNTRRKRNTQFLYGANLRSAYRPLA